MADKQKIVTPDLEKSFSKQTHGMKRIIEAAIQKGIIKEITNRVGNSIDISKIRVNTKRSNT